MDCSEADFELDVGDELFISLIALGIFNHPLKQVHRFFARCFSLLEHRDEEIVSQLIMIFNLCDLRNEPVDIGPEEARPLFDLLGSDETVDSEGNGGIDPFFVLAEFGTTKHTAGDAAHELGEFIGHHYLGPAYFWSVALRRWLQRLAEGWYHGTWARRLRKNRGFLH